MLYDINVTIISLQVGTFVSRAANCPDEAAGRSRPLLPRVLQGPSAARVVEVATTTKSSVRDTPSTCELSSSTPSVPDLVPDTPASRYFFRSRLFSPPRGWAVAPTGLHLSEVRTCIRAFERHNHVFARPPRRRGAWACRCLRFGRVSLPSCMVPEPIAVSPFLALDGSQRTVLCLSGI